MAAAYLRLSEPRLVFTAAGLTATGENECREITVSGGLLLFTFNSISLSEVRLNFSLNIY